jgi:hypothetical protein
MDTGQEIGFGKGKGKGKDLGSEKVKKTMMRDKAVLTLTP